MSRSTPKTGLADRMRAFMQTCAGAVSYGQLYEALQAVADADRRKMRSALRDLIRRGEVVRMEQNVRQVFKFNPSWRKPCKGEIHRKILKAMRLLSFHDAFAASDIQRMADVWDRNYINKIARRLLAAGYLEKKGYRPCLYGAGKEVLYRVTDSDRFRIEMMG